MCHLLVHKNFKFYKISRSNFFLCSLQTNRFQYGIYNISLDFLIKLLSFVELDTVVTLLIFFRATDSQNLPAVAEKARNNGVAVFAVGVASYNLTELLVNYMILDEIVVNFLL